MSEETSPRAPAVEEAAALAEKYQGGAIDAGFDRMIAATESGDHEAVGLWLAVIDILTEHQRPAREG